MRSENSNKDVEEEASSTNSEEEDVDPLESPSDEDEEEEDGVFERRRRCVESSGYGEAEHRAIESFKRTNRS